MKATHAGRLVLSVIPMLCLGARCTSGDSQVDRVNDDGGPPQTDGFVADIAADANPVVDMIPVIDTAGPDAADSGPAMDAETLDAETSGSTCGETSVKVPTTALGLQPRSADGTFHALISEVADDHLVLQPDAGSPVTFLWRGPPLSAEFSVGEEVNCTRASDWSIVTSGKRSAEISILYTNTSRHTGGTTPGGATYSSTPQCESWQSLFCTANSSFTLLTTFYRLVVFQNGASVDIPMGTTAQFGDSRVTNISINSQGTSGGCRVVWDAVNWEMLSVLRSIGP